MISADEISDLLSDDYEGPARWQETPSWRSDKGEWEPVDNEDEMVYDLTEEGRKVRIENVGTFESVANGGIWHDGGEIYQVIRFTDEDGNSEDFIRTGWYSSWDSNQWDYDWQPAEEYTFTEQRWRAR